MRITLQQNEQDCGIYIVKALAEHFHHTKININALRQEASIGPKGMSVYDLKLLAAQNGIILNPFQAQASEVLKNQNELFVVGIKRSRFNHYVVIKIKRDYVSVFDPAKGNYKLLFNEFVKIYNGLVITIEVKTIAKAHHTEKRAETIWNLVFRKTRVVFISFMLIVMLLAFSVASTFFMKIIFDKIIPTQATNLLLLVVFLFLSLAVLRVFASYLKQLFIRKLALELELILYRKYKNKLVTADYRKIVMFEKSDLLRRMLLIETCSLFLSSSVFVLIEEGITMSVALAILIYINPRFFAIVLSASLLTIFISFLFHLIIYPLHKDIFNKAIKNFAFQNISVNEIASAKNQDYRQFSDDNLLNSFYELKTREYRLWKILAFKTIVEDVIASLVPIVITYLFVKEIFNSNNKPGQMLLFLTVTGFFSSPLHTIIDYLLRLRQNLINWNYVKTILVLKDEPQNKTGMQLDQITTISCQHINFSYAEPVLDIENLTFNDSICITADNGTGKSTLLKLLALRFVPHFSYKINDIAYSYYDLDSVRDRIFFLEANQYLPTSRIDAFITLNDSDQMAVFEHNMRRYHLNTFLNRNNIKLSSFLKEGGINLSSGQRQIIALLRLFARKYELIVLDEAIENLSWTNLRFLQSAICDFQSEALFIEVSHTKRYLKAGREINLEAINKVQS